MIKIQMTLIHIQAARVVIARTVATCLHAEVALYGTQAWQSNEIASRSLP
jgi:hypothetical protein